LKLLSGELEPTSGRVTRGLTVKLAHLSQDTAEIPGHLRVLESLEGVRGRTTLADGTELTAGTMCERFGFAGPRTRTLVKDLSGGERRRLQLMRLLMEEPNVLLLDEPTNDLDIDTLSALEDLLDAWPGTLVVVSHDRWFVERVCDDVFGLMGDAPDGASGAPAGAGGALRHLPGGIEQYIDLRSAPSAPGPVQPPVAAAPPSQAVIRAARKEVQRLERALDKLGVREAALHEEMAAAATDHVRLRELQASSAQLAGQRDDLEAAWMEATERAE
jgi:ATP-binding cassette subfamily F protein uup